jgi:hypothetical protein
MAGKVHCWYGAKDEACAPGTAAHTRARSYTEPQPGHRRAHPASAPCHLADHRAGRLRHVQPPGQRERRQQRMAHPARRAPQPAHEDLPAPARAAAEDRNNKTASTKAGGAGRPEAGRPEAGRPEAGGRRFGRSRRATCRGGCGIYKASGVEERRSDDYCGGGVHRVRGGRGGGGPRSCSAGTGTRRRT